MPDEELPIPDLIRQRRKEAGYSSQAALGQALGTTRLHVNSWETGRHSPSEPYAVKLAQAIGGEPGDYMNHDGPTRRVEDEAAIALEQTLAATNELLSEIRDLLTRLAQTEGGS